MKTNGDLLGNVFVYILLSSIFIGAYLNNWKGCFYGILLYVFLMFAAGIILVVTNNYENYDRWFKYYLKRIKIFGLTFKWFSNGR